MSKMKKVLILTVLILVLIQFIRPEKNTGTADGPNDITHTVAVAPEIKNILEKSCNDCHSNHTEYPWYYNIQPVAWWLANHVNDGKHHLNFSEFNTYKTKRKLKKLKELKDEIEEGGMPMDSYLWIHCNAKLSEAEKNNLIKWVNESLITVKDTLK
ncbi:MAG TPA: heme-binding domain-containing protein [Bacteroidia bacterium]